MDSLGFLRDLAIVMLVAGGASLLFQRLRQPALLGYILAGVLIGPHAPGTLIARQEVIGDIADLGVVLLMFTLGLDFSIGKLRRVGGGVLLVAVFEVGTMFLLGYQIGTAFGWGRSSALFLGGAVSLSSTMVVVRVLADQKLTGEAFARNVVSLLVAEDVLSVLLITFLSAVAIGGSIGTGEALSVLGHLVLFVVAFVIVGLLVVPRLLNRVAVRSNPETLLVTTLAICFGACLLAAMAGLSIALGAFLAGAVVAESRARTRILQAVEPLRDMFTALFFVAIGLMINPQLLLEHWRLALVVALLVMGGKLLACGLGTFLVGRGIRRALRVGLSMGAIGEFSFVIVAIGVAHQAVDAALYPTVVAAAVICMALAPLLLRRARPIERGARRLLPLGARRLMRAYTDWLGHLRPVDQNRPLARLIRRLLWHVAVNVTLVVALFIIGAFVNAHEHGWFARLGIDGTLRRGLIWALALFLSLPLLVAIYRKADALGMLAAEVGIRPSFAGAYTRSLRRVLASIIPLATLLALALMVLGLSSTILPPRGVALALVAASVLLALLLWRGLIRVQARFQVALRETLNEDGETEPGETHGP